MQILHDVYSNPDKNQDKYYFQKSRIFLYPALRIEKECSISPVGSYIAWDSINHTDMKLVCLYYVREDKGFKTFEKIKLLGSPMFEVSYEVEPSVDNNQQRVYVFNLEYYAQDWQLFLQGQYSKLSPELKRRIRDYYKRGNTLSYTYIDSYLNPERYFKRYSKFLGTSQEKLRAVGELASKPDLERERLHIRTKIDFSL